MSHACGDHEPSDATAHHEQHPEGVATSPARPRRCRRRRRRGHVWWVLVVSAAVSAPVGALASLWGAHAADEDYLWTTYTALFFLLKSFMKKKVAKKSRQTTSSISHVQHLLPRMLATWLGVGFGLGSGSGSGLG